MSQATFDWHDPVNVRDWIRNHMRGGNITRKEQIEILLELLSVLKEDEHRILDLGCGDGVISELLLERFPKAYVVGLDSSSPMLEAARLRLSRFGGRFTLFNHDLRDTQQPLLEVGAFDAAIGVQSVHHLNSAEKKALFQWVSLSLRDGGLFLLADRIRLASAPLFAYQLRLWDRLQKLAGAEPASDGYSYTDHLANCATRGDFPDGVEDQLRWMRAAGFGEVDEFYRHAERAVFGGLKVPPQGTRQPRVPMPEGPPRQVVHRGL